LSRKQREEKEENDPIRRVQTAIQTFDDKWYLQFERFIEDEYYSLAPDPILPLIRFHDFEKKWYIYQDVGYYKEVPDSTIKQIFFSWADENGVDTQGKVRHAIDRLKSKVHFSPFWDSGEFEGRRVENIKNGLIDLDTRELLPHTPSYFSKYQMPRVYIPEQKTIPEKLEKIYSITPDREILHKFMVSMAQRYFKNEAAMFVYGPRGAGKSTMGLIIQNLFGKELVSNTYIQKLGSRFGLSNLYDKRLNIAIDLPPTKLNADAVAKFKELTGRDGLIEVDVKGTPQFSYPINCFFVYGCNQLMKFKKNATQEIESIMRRLALVRFPYPQIKDPEFKESVCDPDFLDRVFSFLLNEQYEPLCPPGFEDEYISENYRRWLMDSDPVMRIVSELFVYEEEPEYIDMEGNEVFHEIPCYDAVEKVRQAMEDERLLIPNDLFADVTTAMKALKVYKNNKRGSNQMYLNVRMRTDEELEQYLQGGVNN